MKYILFFISLLLPYLASAQVAKDTVTVLTPAQITAASPNDTANIYFVIANAWRKANFDSIARYTRNRFQTLTLDSTHIAANGLNLQGTRFTGVLPVTRGGTGNQTGLAATATALATGRTIQTNLASTSSATFDGTANITPGVTGTLPVGNGGTGAGAFTQGSVVFAGAGGVYSQNNSGLFWDNANGRLGIGTTSPTARLHSYSNTPMNQLTVDGVGAIKSGINFANGGTTYGQIYFDNNAPYDMSILQQYITGSLILGTNNTERMRITNGGNVGIGTTPAVQFHTTGGVRFAGIGTTGTHTYDVRADADGDLFFGTPSDESYKKNIENIKYGIDDIMKLTPIQFNWVGDDSYDVGFIAQDFYNTVPELVYSAPDGKLGIEYEKIVAILTKAIQEQQAQIEALKARITQLENK